MNRWLASIARKAAEWRSRYRPLIVGLLLGSGLADDPLKQRAAPRPIKPKEKKQEETSRTDDDKQS